MPTKIKVVHVRMDENQVERLDALAQETGLPRSHLVRKAVDFYLVFNEPGTKKIATGDHTDADDKIIGIR